MSQNEATLGDTSAWRLVWIALLSLMIAIPTACASSTPTAYVATFDVVGERFRVRVTDPTTVDALQKLKRGESNASIPNGRNPPRHR